MNVCYIRIIVPHGTTNTPDKYTFTIVGNRCFNKETVMTRVIFSPFQNTEILVFLKRQDAWFLEMTIFSA